MLASVCAVLVLLWNGENDGRCFKAERRKKKKLSGSRFDDEGQNNQMNLCKTHVREDTRARRGKGSVKDGHPRRLRLASAGCHRGRNKHNHPSLAFPLFPGPLSSSDERRPGSSLPHKVSDSSSSAPEAPGGSDVPLR